MFAYGPKWHLVTSSGQVQESLIHVTLSEEKLLLDSKSTLWMRAMGL